MSFYPDGTHGTSFPADVEKIQNASYVYLSEYIKK